MSLGDYRTETPAAKMSTHLRDETECTRSIATFCDLHECVMRRRCEHARRRIIVQVGRALIAEWHNGQRASVGVRVANGKDVVDLVGTDKSVDFRNLRFQLVSITLNEAAGDD